MSTPNSRSRRRPALHDGTNRLLTILAALTNVGSIPTVQAQSGRAMPERDSYAVTNVSVIPMTRDTVLRDATVIVRNGRIASVGPSSQVTAPSGVRVIDGRGKYLIPGLVDVHSHLFSDADAPDSVGRYELGALVANGITATRLMMGTKEQIALRREVGAGRILGPALWLASPEFAGKKYGPDFRGFVAGTPAEARSAVQAAAAEGYDFIKITLFIGPEAYDALVDEAKRRGIPVVGHVDPSVGVPHALAKGQHIEHLDNYLEQVLADSSPVKISVSDRGVYFAKNWESLDYIDEKKIDKIAGLTARSGTYTTPTLTIPKNFFALGVSDDVIGSWPDRNLYPPEVWKLWLSVRDKYWASPAAESRRRRWIETRNRITKAISDSGGRIVVGSDSPELLHAYGLTLHRELKNLAEAGLTPYQVLVAATRTPSQFFGAAKEFGTVEAGKRADLVLLGANPLEDIGNTSKIEAVSVGGRWLAKSELDRMLRLASERLQAVAAGGQ